MLYSISLVLQKISLQWLRGNMHLWLWYPPLRLQDLEFPTCGPLVIDRRDLLLY